MEKLLELLQDWLIAFHNDHPFSSNRKNLFKISNLSQSHHDAKLCIKPKLLLFHITHVSMSTRKTRSTKKSKGEVECAGEDDASRQCHINILKYTPACPLVIVFRHMYSHLLVHHLEGGTSYFRLPAFKNFVSEYPIAKKLLTYHDPYFKLFRIFVDLTAAYYKHTSSTRKDAGLARKVTKLTITFFEVLRSAVMSLTCFTSSEKWKEYDRGISKVTHYLESIRDPSKLTQTVSQGIQIKDKWIQGNWSHHLIPREKSSHSQIFSAKNRPLPPWSSALAIEEESFPSAPENLPDTPEPFNIAEAKTLSLWEALTEAERLKLTLNRINKHHRDAISIMQKMDLGVFSHPVLLLLQSMSDLMAYDGGLDKLRTIGPFICHFYQTLSGKKFSVDKAIEKLEHNSSKSSVSVKSPSKSPPSYSTILTFPVVTFQSLAHTRKAVYEVFPTFIGEEEEEIEESQAEEFTSVLHQNLPQVQIKPEDEAVTPGKETTSLPSGSSKDNDDDSETDKEEIGTDKLDILNVGTPSSSIALPPKRKSDNPDLNPAPAKSSKIETSALPSSISSSSNTTTTSSSEDKDKCESPIKSGNDDDEPDANDLAAFAAAVEFEEEQERQEKLSQEKQEKLEQENQEKLAQEKQEKLEQENQEKLNIEYAAKIEADYDRLLGLYTGKEGKKKKEYQEFIFDLVRADTIVKENEFKKKWVCADLFTEHFLMVKGVFEKLHK